MNIEHLQLILETISTTTGDAKQLVILYFALQLSKLIIAAGLIVFMFCGIRSVIIKVFNLEEANVLMHRLRQIRSITLGDSTVREYTPRDHDTVMEEIRSLKEQLKEYKTKELIKKYT